MKKVYKKLWFVILVGIFIPPYAIFATWKFMNYKKSTKIILTVVWFLWLVSLIGGQLTDSENDNDVSKKFSITNNYIEEGTEDEYFNKIEIEYDYESYIKQEGLQLVCGEDLDLDRTINYTYTDTNDTTLMHFTSTVEPDWSGGKVWEKRGSFECPKGQMLDIYGDDGTIKFTAPREIKVKGKEVKEISDVIYSTSEKPDAITCLRDEIEVNCEKIKNYSEMKNELDMYIDKSLKEGLCTNRSIDEYELKCE